MDYKTIKSQLDDLIQKANDKETIDALAKMSNDMDTFAQEHDKVVSKNVELTNAYKEAILHSSIKDKPPVDNITVEPKTVDFNAILNDVLATQNKK